MNFFVLLAFLLQILPVFCQVQTGAGNQGGLGASQGGFGGPQVGYAGPQGYPQRPYYYRGRKYFRYSLFFYSSVVS